MPAPNLTLPNSRWKPYEPQITPLGAINAYNAPKLAYQQQQLEGKQAEQKRQFAREDEQWLAELKSRLGIAEVQERGRIDTEQMREQQKFRTGERIAGEEHDVRMRGIPQAQTFAPRVAPRLTQRDQEAGFMTEPGIAELMQEQEKDKALIAAIQRDRIEKNKFNAEGKFAGSPQFPQDYNLDTMESLARQRMAQRERYFAEKRSGVTPQLVQQNQGTSQPVDLRSFYESIRQPDEPPFEELDEQDMQVLQQMYSQQYGAAQ